MRMIDTKHNTFTLSLTKVIVVFVGGLFAIYVVAPVVAPVAAHVVAQVYVYGFIPDLISPIVDWFK
jgi:hypothetical protein